jgi:hypothetical protein
MTFVPIVPAGPSQASPNAQELGRRIVALIQEYQQNHPDTSRTDVRQALKIAELSVGAGFRGNPALIAIIVAVLLLGLLMGFLHSAGSFDPDGKLPMIAVLGVIVLVIGVVAAIRASR